MQGLFQWLYGLFLDLIAYCANALLGVMTTDLTFWETSVPVVGTLYQILVAVGWGLLIGNLAFQSMKAMFAGLGFETESPAILLLRTGLFGTLLIFSKDICEIGLSIGKNVITLIGVPGSITITFPTGDIFSNLDASWLLVIIIGFVLGFQLIKLFFEIAERYVVVAVLTLLCPIGLAMGGSKSTKDICTGFMRTYASMIVMTVMNVLFLKLVLSALATMPSGIMVLPWCLLVVGIVKVARKADNLITKIGLSPAITGDPLGHGRGTMVAMMAARTIMRNVSKSGNSKSDGGKSSGSHGANSNNVNSSTRNTAGGTNIGGANMHTASSSNSAEQNSTNAQNSQSAKNVQDSHFGAAHSTANTQNTSSTRFGSSNHGNSKSTGVSSSHAHFGSTGAKNVNTNRFGQQISNSPSGQGAKKPSPPMSQAQGTKISESGIKTTPRTAPKAAPKTTPKTAEKGASKIASSVPAKKGQFGSVPVGKSTNDVSLPNRNENPFRIDGSDTIGSIHTTPRKPVGTNQLSGGQVIPKAEKTSKTSNGGDLNK